MEFPTGRSRTATGFDRPPLEARLLLARVFCNSEFVVDGELVGTVGGGGSGSGSDGLEFCDGGGPRGRAARGGLVNTAAPRLRILLPLHRSPILLQVD